MNFDKWLDTLVEEKGLDPYGTTFELDVDGLTHFVPLAVVMDFLKGNHPEDQETAKEHLVNIDFHNGDVNHFFRYVAKFMAEQYDGVLS